ncbi:hypothetical protein KAK05_03290 [Candidatus Parcubacteria bacterium]|nr:hypothetical protein [Spirochaetota bacterium]MCK5085709.1 hypothetical protein [Candidatus Parcubacteria bacterium]
MKRKVFFIISLFLIINVVLLKSTEFKTDWETDKLKGKIKKIERTTHEFSFREKKMKFMGNEIIQYNRNGMKIEQIRNNRITKYFYDGNNNLIKENFDNFYKIYKYNNKNLVIEESMVEKATNKIDDKRIYIYDKSENLAIYEVYKSNKLFKKWIFKYDKNGKELEHTIYNADGSYDNKYMFKYNKEGKVIEIIEHNFQENEYYTYHKNGNIASYKNYDELKKYEYDNQNNIIKEISETSYRTIFYNYKYIFDSNNNIISTKVYFKNVKDKKNILFKTIETKITYY